MKDIFMVYFEAVDEAFKKFFLHYKNGSSFLRW